MDKLESLPFFKSKPWFANSNSIWMLTNFELHRNLKNHFFPHCLEAEFAEKLGEMMKQALLSCPLLKKSQAFQASSLNPHEKQLLYEYFLPRKAFIQLHSGETFILDNSGRSYMTLQFEDHLHFHKLDTEERLEETWTELLKLECHLSESLEFAYSPKFGFTTANHKLCGTGLIIQTFLHLPALIHLNKLNEVLQKANKTFFNIQGFGGSLESILGDLVLVSNRHTLGISEETLLKNIRRVTLELIMAEKSLRGQLTSQETQALKDLIGKAFGSLRHSSQLSLKESLSYLSLCKLGVELGWIKGITLEEINTLFFSVRKGFLSLYYPKVPEDELAKKRSDFLHKKIDLMTFES